MKILIIDDDVSLAETLKLSLETAIPGVQVKTHETFATALNAVREFGPDAIILDIYEGANEMRGDAISERVWNGHFCPLVIYTARAERNQIPLADHPFVRFSRKATGTDVEVVQHIQDFNPHIQAVLEIQAEIITATRESLRDVCSIIWTATDNETDRRELVGRITRRRMAAHLDSAIDGNALRAWEQFIFPAASRTLLTGDILKARSDDSYRMVLTPSCDLVPGRSVSKVLTACSSEIRSFFEAAGYANIGEKKLRDKLPEKLRLDQVGGFIAIPALPSIFQTMAFNLKELDLIPFDNISLTEDSQKTYFRLASVDSPFREKMAWAYMQVGGRPGVPDLDVKKFAEELTPSA